jgi:hypothetical protein
MGKFVRLLSFWVNLSVANLEFISNVLADSRCISAPRPRRAGHVCPWRLGVHCRRDERDSYSIYLESSFPEQPGHEDMYEAMCGALEDMDTIAIPSKTLDVTYQQVRVILDDGIVSYHMVPERWERLLLDKLTVRDDGQKVKESWPRLIEDVDDKAFVEDWPELKEPRGDLRETRNVLIVV